MERLNGVLSASRAEIDGVRVASDEAIRTVDEFNDSLVGLKNELEVGTITALDLFIGGIKDAGEALTTSDGLTRLWEQAVRNLTGGQVESVNVTRDQERAVRDVTAANDEWQARVEGITVEQVKANQELREANKGFTDLIPLIGEAAIVYDGLVPQVEAATASMHNFTSAAAEALSVLAEYKAEGRFATPDFIDQVTPEGLGFSGVGGLAPQGDSGTSPTQTDSNLQQDTTPGA